MLSEAAVLKAIIECMDEERNAMLISVRDKLDCDDLSLFPFLNSLKNKHYIIQSTYDAHVTDLGMKKYHEAFTNKSKQIKESVSNSAKFTLKQFLVIITVVVGSVISAAIIYHFGWQ